MMYVLVYGKINKAKVTENVWLLKYKKKKKKGEKTELLESA